MDQSLFNESLQPNREVTELRGSNYRVYRLSTTTQKAVFYPQAAEALDAGLVSGEEALAASAAVLAATDAARSGTETTATLVAYAWNGETATDIGEPVRLDATTQMRIELQTPTLPRNPRIRRAELVLPQVSAVLVGQAAKLMLYRVDGTTRTLLDYCPARTDETEPYCFDVTTLLDVAATEEATAILLEVELDTLATNESVTLYGTGADNPSQLQVTYDAGYRFTAGARAHTHSLGRFGQGSVDLQTRTLMLESEDFAWGGNRLPVTIRHQYNSALCGYQYTGNSSIGLHAADFSGMKLGQGWRLNLMQSLVPATFVHEGVTYTGYVYVDESGEETYLKPGDVAGQYVDVDGGDLIATVTATERTLQMGEETYTFDSAGRLVSITDGHGNTQTMSYTDGQLTSVTDGAGRTFALAYDDTGYLTSITAPDGTAVTYTYSGNYLYNVTYPDGTLVKLFRSNKKPNNVFVYGPDEKALIRYNYTFDASGDRLASLTERGSWESSADTVTTATAPVTAFAYSPAAGQATVTLTQPADTAEGETEATVTTTVYTFDDDGDVVGEYQYVNSGENVGLTGNDPATAEGGIGARLYSDNWLSNHDFTTDSDWTPFASNDSLTATFRSKLMYDCNHCVLLTSTDEATDGGLRQTTAILPAGEYTFSARMRVHNAKIGIGLSGTDAGMYVKVTSAVDSTLLAESSRVNFNDRTFQLLTAPFTLTEATPVCVEIGMVGAGTVVVDSAQLESNPFASPHNRLANGGFEKGTIGWQSSDVLLTGNEEPFGGNLCLRLTGDLDSQRNAWQVVDCLTPAAVRETFTLSGWGRATSLPITEEDDKPVPAFRLRAVVKLNGILKPEEYTADFVSGTTGWQFSSVQFSKAQHAAVEYIHIYCDYDYNTGSAFFDNIQLVRDSLETGLTVADFSGYETEDTDTDSTDYEDTATDSLVPEFEELVDGFGNPITETTFTDGEFGTIYRSFEYNINNLPAETSTEEDDEGNAGNDLIRETDARGFATEYTVDPLTSRNMAVKDRCGNITAYEYDAEGRMTKVTSKNAAGVEQAHVSYAYNSMGNLTSITRGDGMAYGLTYNPYHELATIGVTGKAEPLVSYAYKNGHGRLKSVTYANRTVMKVTYNGLGQVVAEKWYDALDKLVAHYKYAYDGDGNLVRSIDILACKEYTYTYEAGQLKASEEFDITVGDYENVTSRTLVTYLHYAYDEDGNLTARFTPSDYGTEYYRHPEEGDPVLTFYSGIQRVTSHSKSDGFGRKVFDELQLGTGFVSRRYDYVVGDVTDEHINGEKLKSSPTTNLVSRITYADGRTIEYEYDKEERITKVIDSVDGTTEYTYDALGQLLTETVNGVVVNTMTYDNYGNILTKNGVTYGYDSTWKDLLTSYNGNTIEYDEQGNPTKYFGYELAWEKGRQLKELTKPDGKTITYTYNANGIRTSKTVGTSKHTYILDGTKILSESHGAITTYVQYDSEGSVCGINYNGTPYYFLKNQQGDIIAITDKNGGVVARYRYDAWGVCTIVSDTTQCGIANINPFRYRSYYYDTETGLYYLQSRYYDPETGRFVNADDVSVVIKVTHDEKGNTYSYVSNCPVNKTDESGQFSLKFLAFGLQIAFSFGRISAGVELLWDLNTGKFYPFVFFGPGGSKDVNGLMGYMARCMLTPLKKQRTKSATAILKFLSKLSVSVSAIIVFGSSNKKMPVDYYGWFNCFSVTLRVFWANLILSGAFSNQSGYIASFGVGLSSDKPLFLKFGIGKAYYVHLNGLNSIKKQLLDLFDPLRESAASRQKALRTAAKIAS